MESAQPIQTSVSTVIRNAEDIIEVRILPNVVQSMEGARRNIDACLQQAAGKRLPLLLDLTHALPLQPDVRRYYASKEVGEQFAAIALVVNASPFGLSIGNFYLNLTRGVGVQKLFHDPKEAYTWLRGVK